MILRCVGSPDCKCCISKGDIQGFCEHKKQSFSDATCPVPSCGHPASAHGKRVDSATSRVECDRDSVMAKVKSGIPVLVSEIQTCQSLVTGLIDAVDRTWHIVRAGRSIPRSPPTLLLEDCPRIGVSAVGLDVNARGKVRKFRVPPFSALEILVLLRKATQNKHLSFSSIRTLWTFFEGNPDCYHALFRARKLDVCLANPMQAELEATKMLQQECERIRPLFHTTKLELWKRLSAQAHFDHSNSSEFAWLHDKGIVDRLTFMKPHGVSFIVTPSFSRNAITPLAALKLHGLDSLVVSAITGMIEANLWPFPFEQQQHHAPFKITSQWIKMREGFNDMLFFLHAAAGWTEIVVYVTPTTGLDDLLRELSLLSQQQEEEEESRDDDGCKISRVHVIHMRATAASSSSSSCETKEEEQEQEQQKKNVFSARLTPQRGEEEEEEEDLRVVEEEGGRWWPIINRSCYKTAQEQFDRAKACRRPLLLEGAAKSGKSTLIDLLCPGVVAETLSLKQ